MAHIIVDSLNI